MYTRLNHLNATISYTATLKAVNEISCLHKVPLQQWIADGIEFKFVGDNVNKKGVRDIRSDNQIQLHHMFSMLVVRGCTQGPPHPLPLSQHSLSFLEVSSLLLTSEDVEAIKKNLVVLVSRILCKYKKPLNFLAKIVPAHIQHKFSEEMAKKSETVVLDVLMKNEAKHSDMHDIMKVQPAYLGDGFPGDKQVLSGGDQLTCERERCARRHRMDADTPRERLQLLEPVVEDWHTMQSFLGVSEVYISAVN